ncbi:uncharacterized protein LOC114253595 isoform X2 [Bombyx mandarina]|uniref:Uncharacterized protein LOC114253595 isoform X1 n=1 Tax=Bombyx mandarina TaxID=7092 RepID=A0A6J2KS20_BOMMA|nr:uncharacterized protein LOC114253595 isoform X1 [Bombyx mandarina]XP_028044348.1 uncharacterized protein LOC114253595 isoform X2 [Bombyx mandarina]
MIGYSLNQKGYRFVDIKNPTRLIIARDAVFFENVQNYGKETIHLEYVDSAQSNEVLVNNNDHLVMPQVPVHIGDPDAVGELGMNTPDPTTSTNESTTSTNERRYSKRIRRPKVQEDMIYNFLITEGSDPKSVEDALKRSDRELWHTAMLDEYNALMQNKTSKQN